MVNRVVLLIPDIVGPTDRSVRPFEEIVQPASFEYRTMLKFVNRD